MLGFCIWADVCSATGVNDCGWHQKALWLLPIPRAASWHRILITVYVSPQDRDPMLPTAQMPSPSACVTDNRTKRL